MKTATLIARILLGSVFVVFGLNGFLHFIPQPPMPEVAAKFFGGLVATHYMLPLLFGTQVVGGALLLLGMVALGVVILAPVIVNIVAFHLFVVPSGLGIALIVAALEVFLAWTHRDAYRPLFASGRPDAPTPRGTSGRDARVAS